MTIFRPNLAFSALAAIALVACSNQGIMGQAPSAAKKVTTHKTQSNDDTEADQGGTGTAGDQAATDPNGGADDSGISDAGTSTGTGQSLDDLIKSCGVTQQQLSDPNAVLFNTAMNSYPKVVAGTQSVLGIGINYRVTVVVKATVTATPMTTKQTFDFDVTAEPSLAQSQAEAQVNPNKGYTLSTGMALQERTDMMSKQPDWKGIFCTVQPTVTFETNKGGHDKVVKFDPPLPASISPMADKSRYDAEITGPRTFSNITATVQTSNDPAVPQGTTMTGSVTITPIAPSLTVNQNGGGTVATITSDVAYKLEFNFGSGTADTVKLGLMPMQMLFIDNATKTVKAVVGDTGDPTQGTVVLAAGL